MNISCWLTHFRSFIRKRVASFGDQILYWFSEDFNQKVDVCLANRYATILKMLLLHITGFMIMKFDIQLQETYDTLFCTICILSRNSLNFTTVHLVLLQFHAPLKPLYLRSLRFVYMIPVMMSLKCAHACNSDVNINMTTTSNKHANTQYEDT